MGDGRVSGRQAGDVGGQVHRVNPGVKATMDSYILRIYHRDIQGSHAVVGTLETPDGLARYVFRNVEELWSILRHDATAGDPLDRERDDRNRE
jgi:hypothetical protein